MSDLIAPVGQTFRATPRAPMALSVIIPSRERSVELKRCLRALTRQDLDKPFEVIVVDDSPAQTLELPSDVPAVVRVVRSGGRGPAIARNAGVREAQSEILVFTDDDTIPSVSWLKSVHDHMQSHPSDVGVEGPTVSPPFDPLTEHSIQNDVAGAFFTCNVAYRRRAFDEAGGFFVGFPFAHCEDLDLGFRLNRVGAMGFASGMEVLHPPRPMTIRQEIRRSRYCGSEIVLRSRHPDLYTDYPRTPLRWRPVLGLMRSQLRLLRSGQVHARTSPCRLARWLYVTSGKMVVAVVTCARTVAV